MWFGLLRRRGVHLFGHPCSIRQVPHLIRPFPWMDSKGVWIIIQAWGLLAQVFSEPWGSLAPHLMWFGILKRRGVYLIRHPCYIRQVPHLIRALPWMVSKGVRIINQTWGLLAQVFSGSWGSWAPNLMWFRLLKSRGVHLIQSTCIRPIVYYSDSLREEESTLFGQLVFDPLNVIRTPKKRRSQPDSDNLYLAHLIVHYKKNSLGRQINRFMGVIQQYVVQE